MMLTPRKDEDFQVSVTVVSSRQRNCATAHLICEGAYLMVREWVAGARPPNNAKVGTRNRRGASKRGESKSSRAVEHSRHLQFASLAQRLERWAHSPNVVGSNPT